MSAWAAFLLLLGAPLLAAPATPTTLDAQSRACIDAAVGDAKTALPIAARGLVAAREQGDHSAESRFLRCQAYAKDALGDSTQAFADYAAAVTAAEAGGDAEALADALTGRGELLQFSGEYDGAIADLKQAYDIYHGLQEAGSQNYVLNAMANLYADPNVGEYDKAIDYYHELLETHRAAGKQGEVATAHFNLGATYDSQHDDAKALAEYRSALTMYQALDDSESIAEARRVIGAVLARQGHRADALHAIDQALRWYGDVGNTEGVARTRLTRGIALHVLGQASDALRDLAAARDHFAREGNQRFLLRIDQERARAFSALGRWQEAYAALRSQLDAQRSLDKALIEGRISRLRVQFDTERTLQVNRTLRAENASRGLALRAAERERRLQGIALLLGGILIALLLGMAIRQLLKLRRLRVLAATDELTGAANRRSILAYLDEKLLRGFRSGEPVSVIAFDADFFKRVNDTFGHDAGDKTLRRIVALASEGARADDRLGRVGGEEFLLVVPGARQSVAMEMAERIRQRVAGASFEDITPGAGMTLSLGVAEWHTGESADSLRNRADEALYAAKQTGRNRTVGAQDA